MISYSAPNPYQEKRGFFSFFSFFSISGSASIGNMVLPAQWREPQKLSASRLNHLAQTQRVYISGGYITTYDEAIIDTISLAPIEDALKPIGEQQFIIKFNGNGVHYEDMIQEYVSDARSLQQTVIGFNYRGVGNSQKKPQVFQDLVTDGIAQVQRLLAKGANPEHILLDGHSLGGSVATMVALHFHRLNQCVYLWNDRSFSSLSSAAAGLIAPNHEMVQTSLTSTTWSVMKPSGWEVNIAKAYKEIPAKYKSYMALGKPSNHCAGDGVIAHQASLAYAVKPQEKETQSITGHKVYSMFAGHNLSRNELLTKDRTKTGQDLFEQFASRGLR